MSPTLISTAFAHQGAIPAKYTCEGADVSPPFQGSAKRTSASFRTGRTLY